MNGAKISQSTANGPTDKPVANGGHPEASGTVLKRAASTTSQNGDDQAKKAKTAPPQGSPPLKNHRHKAVTSTLMSRFDELLAEGAADGWIDVINKKGQSVMFFILFLLFSDVCRLRVGVDIANKPGVGPTGYLRGTTTVAGFSPMEFFAVIYHPQIRPRCICTHPFFVCLIGNHLVVVFLGDELFDFGELVEILDLENRTTLVYAATKPFWPTASRDLCVVQVIEGTPGGTLRVATKSVTDSLRGEVSGKVRAISEFAGWCFEPSGDGTKVTYDVPFALFFRPCYV